MSKEQLMVEFEKIYLKTFKDSKLTYNYGCFGKDTIFVDLYLAKNKEELASGLFDNDFMNIILELKFDNENITFSSVRNSYIVKTENKYMYCNYKKVAFRQVKGDYTKVLGAFSKFVDRLHTSILEDIKANNIHDNYREIVGKKVVE